MSDKSHSIFTRIMMGLLMILMIAGVAVWGINDILIGSSNKTVAKVGNSKVSESELENMVQNHKMQLMQSGINDLSEELKTVIRNNALVNLIGDRLIQNELRHLNIQLDEKDVLKHDYLSQPDFDKEKLKGIARSQGGEDAFLKHITKEKKIDFVQGSLTATDPITESMVQNIYNFENQTRNIDYVELKTNIVKIAGEPVAAELQEFYDKNKDNFIAPESRAISYIVIDKNTIKNSPEGSDLTTQLHDMTNAILDKIAGGETLEEVAKEYSLEVNKVKYISSSGLSEDGKEVSSLPKVNNFVATVFATDQDQVSDILESDNGSVYSLVRVDSINEKRIKSLDEVKSLAIEGWKTQKKAEKMVDIAKELKIDLDSGKITLAEFASKNGVEVKHKTNIGLKNSGFPPEFSSEVFNLRKGTYSNINRSNDNALIIAKLTGINTAAAPEKLGLFEYKARIQDQISQEIMAEYLDYLKGKYSVRIYK